jgi:5-methylcytosine-specific restriction endonuclease McrA
VRVDKIEKYERNFCSEECGNAWRREYYSGEANPRSQEKYEVECSHCGSTLQRIEYYVEHNEHHFCDRDCLGEWRSENWNRENHPNWKGGVAREYGPNWKQKRRAVRQRDDFECQRCRLSDGEHRDEFGHGLHVHHVVPRAEFLNADGSIEHERANRMTNLVTLCQQCHVEVEGESNRFNL